MRKLWFLVLVCCLCTVPAAAPAADGVGARVQAWAWYDQPLETTADITQTAPYSQYLEYTAAQGPAIGISRAQVTLGAVKLYSHSQSTPLSEAYSTVWADYWWDMTINSGPAGTQGTYKPQIWVGGSESAGADCMAGHSLEVFKNNINYGSWVGGYMGSSYTGYPLNQMYTATIPITFGVPFSMYVATWAQTTLNATTDMWNSVYWMGFAEVRDASGNLVTDYTVQSASGIDWSQPIPEPSGMLALLGGLGSLGVLWRRRK
jgi:hypothetical protein